MERKPSTQWVSASIPVAAVKSGGRVMVKSGSQIARSGCTWIERMDIAGALVSGWMPPPKVISAPVPAVVGMVIYGATSAVIF